jgi:signal transduction histidine kinase
MKSAAQISSMSMRKHLVRMILVAVVPVILFSAAMMFAMVRNEHRAMQASLEAQAGQLGIGIDDELRRTIAKLEGLGQSAALSNGDLKAFDEMVRRVMGTDVRWENLMLLSPEGRQLVNVRMPFGSRLPELNRPDLPMRAAQSQQPVVSDMARADIAGRPLTVVYVPLVQQGSVHYVLGAAIEPPKWKQALRSQLPAGMQALLLDGASSVVTATGSTPADVSAPDPVSTMLRAEAADHRASVEERVRLLTGSKSYVGYHRSPFSGWTVATFLPADEFDGQVRRSAAFVGAGFLALLAFGLTLALLLARRTERSISQLLASVKAVAVGGEPLPIETDVSEVNEAGHALTETATLLSARLRSEQTAHAEVEAAGRAKNAFLAMLGHELRNPLATVSHAVEFMTRTEASDEEKQWAGGVIDRQSAHVARLLDDLLDVARIDRGKIELRKEIIDLRELLRGAVCDQRALGGRTSAPLNLELPPAAVWVEADRVRLAQVIGNLLHNAVKFTPPGGAIGIRLLRQRGHAEVRIKDSGAGIDPGALERIFEPFTQDDQDRARSAGGLGLGLALAKMLVQLHGGTVRAASEGKRHGAEFTVSLPTADQAA